MRRASTRARGTCSEPSDRSLGLPNGSRLSCGASAGGRKRPALRYRLAGA